MGNRAYIKSAASNDVALYLHWNGGYDSVTGFLRYCELQCFPGFGRRSDGCAFARLSQVVSNFMGSDDGSNVAIQSKFSDRQDNGLYEVEGWKIVRHTIDGVAIEVEHHEGYDLDEMLAAIDRKQPEYLRIGKAITGQGFPVGELKLGDKVFLKSLRGWRNYEVVEFKKEGGFFSDVHRVPYVSLCGEGQESSSARSITNYLYDKETCIRVDVG